MRKKLFSFLAITLIIGFLTEFSASAFAQNSAALKQSASNKIRIRQQRKQQQLWKKDNIIKRLTPPERPNIINDLKIMPKEAKEDVICLALNIYHENRALDLLDSIAMTYTVFNRLHARANDYKNACETIFDYRQYSWTNPNRVQYPIEKKPWEYAQEIANVIYNDGSSRGIAADFASINYVANWLLPNLSKNHWANRYSCKLSTSKHSYLFFTKENCRFIPKIKEILKTNEEFVDLKIKNPNSGLIGQIKKYIPPVAHADAIILRDIANVALPFKKPLI
jgi:hypothetical protein